MLFDSIISSYQLFLPILYAFFTIFLLRHLFIKRKTSIFLYHILLFCILFIMEIGGAGVQNEEYGYLKEFVELEKNHTLDQVKSGAQPSQIPPHLLKFKNSDEFRFYLKMHDNRLDKVEAILIGWILVLISDVAIICVYILRYIANKLGNRFI
ncbi:MAG: hypothetical protein SFT91_05925 [Rickettsiaceae bacterium]|nr:hypothetical protein [Rickettsiaceae bacterium]